MPRPLRIDYPGACHHVMNRGARKENIFLDNSSRIGFLSRLAEVADRYAVRIHGYVLMPNHYHLMAESTRGLLSDCIRDLQAPFVRMQNWLHGDNWDGPLFRGRFRSRLVYSEDHWTYLLAYIHLNPLRARLVMDLDQYDWSSHLSYAGDAPCPEWLYMNDLLARFGSNAGYLEFVKGVAVKRIRPPKEFDDLVTPIPADLPAVLSAEFDEGVVAEALDSVAAASGVRSTQLFERCYGRRGNVARLAAIYWLVNGIGLSRAETGRRLKMTTSGVCRALARIERRVARDGELRLIIDKLLNLKRS